MEKEKLVGQGSGGGVGRVSSFCWRESRTLESLLAVLSAMLLVWSICEIFWTGMALSLLSLSLSCSKWRRNAIRKTSGSQAYRIRGKTDKCMLVLVCWVSLLLLVRVLSLGNYMEHWPSACYPVAFGVVPEDCLRVVHHGENSPAGEGLKPLTLSSSRAKVQEAAREWLDAYLFQSKVVVRTGKESFVHAQVLTALMGYKDDLGVKVDCSKDAMAVVSIHFEQRLGSKDFGLQRKRMREMYTFLEQSKLPEEKCT